MSGRWRWCAVPVVAMLAGCGGGTTAVPQTVTFNRHIAPIIYGSCASCHRPGEAAPFSLLSYADVVKHVQAVGEQTQRRQMPPWLPADADLPIVGVRRLRPEQVDMIQRWIASGTPEGDPADRPPAPVFPDGWLGGTPDAVLTVPAAYTATPRPDDIYRNLVYRTSFDTDVFVRAVEFKTNGAPIHHAVMRIDTTSMARRHDGEDGQPGFDGMTSRWARDPDGQFVGWAPGRGPIETPDGMPWRLPRGASIVLEMHMVPPKAPVRVQPTIAIFVSKTPPVRTPVALHLGTKSIDIPPGESNYVVTESIVLPVAADLLSVYPHAHYLGRDMRLEAARPDGVVRTLLHIPRWDFHWQQDYRFVTPEPLPAGTRITMRYTYDNSDGNRMNPSHPPVRVQLGPRSVDEMGEMGLQLLPASPRDAATLIRTFDDHHTEVTLAAADARVRREPNVAQYQAFLGAAYLMAGRPADAVAPLEAAIRLDPRRADAHSDLGTALVRLRRLPDALPHLQRAAALAPKDENMAYNLANALADANRLGEAVATYQRALAINPDLVDAHVNLGGLLMQTGRTAAALPHLERAVALDPSSPANHTDLSTALAASGRYRDALREAQAALQIAPDFAPALDNIRRLNALGIR